MAGIHITGASGSGTTSLGAALAARLGIPHFDADNYFWEPSRIPYTIKRPPRLRNEMLLADLGSGGPWVVSGSMTGWGCDPERFFTLVVYLWLPTALRLERLRLREAEQFGKAIEPGGEMHAGYEEFIAWAGNYDSAGFEQRSKAGHEAWLDELTCPVLRIPGDLTNTARADLILAAME